METTRNQLLSTKLPTTKYQQQNYLYKKILNKLYKERTFQKQDATHLTRKEFKQGVKYVKVSITSSKIALPTSTLNTTPP